MDEETDYRLFAARLHLLGSLTLALTIVLPHWDTVNEPVVAAVAATQLGFAVLAFGRPVFAKRAVVLMPLPGLVTISVAVWAAGPGAASATAGGFYAMLTIGAFSFLPAYVGAGYVLAAATVYAVLLVRWDTDGWPAQVMAVATMSFTVGWTAGWLNRKIRSLAAREREGARRLARLQEAFAALTTSPGLDATIDSVLDEATRAVAAAASVVLLRTGDELVLAGMRAPGLVATDDALARGAPVNLDCRSCAVCEAMRDARSVMTDDVFGRSELPTWARGMRPAFREASIRSMVTVPLRTGSEVIGAMETVFAGTVPEGVDTVRMLEAFAEQVTQVIVRAQVYEREHGLALELARADALKSQFLAMASHELRVPLTAAKGFVDTVLLQWDRLDDSARQSLLARASRNAGTLAGLIDQLLEYSRVTSDVVTLDRAPLRVAEAAQTAALHLAPALARHRLILDVPGDLTVVADRDAFDSVLANLVSNAAKYSLAGTAIRIAAEIDTEADEVLVTVTDEGPGIPLDEQDELFEPFFRRSADRGRSGTGLGLPIARRYVEALGGRIWVESEPGHGSTFVVALPIPSAASEPPASPGLTPEGTVATLDRPV